MDGTKVFGGGDVREFRNGLRGDIKKIRMENKRFSQN